MNIPQEHRHYRNTPFAPVVSLDMFSELERRQLTKYGAWLDALMGGQIQPYTKAQEHFVLMYRGKEKPETEIEHVWYRYCVEDLYQRAVRLEASLATGRISYAEVRKQFLKVAHLGHDGARDWLRKEGEWHDSPSEKNTSVGVSTAYKKGSLYGITNLYHSLGDVLTRK